jgi:hypothetical protein
VDLTFEARFKANGHNHTDEEIGAVLDLLVEKGKLNRVEVNGGMVYRIVKSAKGYTDRQTSKCCRFFRLLDEEDRCASRWD